MKTSKQPETGVGDLRDGKTEKEIKGDRQKDRHTLTDMSFHITLSFMKQMQISAIKRAFGQKFDTNSWFSKTMCMILITGFDPHQQHTEDEHWWCHLAPMLAENDSAPFHVVAQRRNLPDERMET